MYCSETTGTERVFIYHLQLYHTEFKKLGSAENKIETVLFKKILTDHGFNVKRAPGAHCTPCKRVAESSALKKFKYPTTVPPTYISNGTFVLTRDRKKGEKGIHYCATCETELRMKNNMDYFIGILKTREVEGHVSESDEDA